MQKIILKPWFPIICFYITATIDRFIFGMFPLEIKIYLHDITQWLYIGFIILFIYTIGWNIIQGIKKVTNRNKDH
mgnify:CR=1 FL=1